MAIQATNPTIVPPTTGATYNLWWVYGVAITAADPGNVQAAVTLRKYRVLPDGVSVEFSPTDPPVQFTTTQIMQSTDANVQNAMAAIMTAVQALAQAQNLL